MDFGFPYISNQEVYEHMSCKDLQGRVEDDFFGWSKKGPSQVAQQLVKS